MENSKIEWTNHTLNIWVPKMKKTDFDYMQEAMFLFENKSEFFFWYRRELLSLIKKSRANEIKKLAKTIYAATESEEKYWSRMGKKFREYVYNGDYR